VSTHRSGKARPVVNASRVLGGIYAFAGGLLVIPGLSDVPHLDTGVGVVLLACTAVSVALGVKIEGQVTPHEDVLSFVSRDQELTAGPRAGEFVDDDEDPAATPPVGDVDSAGYPRI